MRSEMRPDSSADNVIAGFSVLSLAFLRTIHSEKSVTALMGTGSMKESSTVLRPFQGVRHALVISGLSLARGPRLADAFDALEHSRSA